MKYTFYTDKSPTDKNKIIESHKDFIYNYTCYICKKTLDWKNDDELSIALIAFNEALDTFDNNSSSSFLGYARLVMKNRLIDYFKNEKKHASIYLENEQDNKAHPAEVKAAYNSFEKELDRRDKAYEIEEFEKVVTSFNFSFFSLVENCPKHNDTRQNLMQIAQKASSSQLVVTKMHKTKKLPIKEIRNLTGASRKILETWRCYLIALILINTNEKFTSLKEYIFSGKEG